MNKFSHKNAITGVLFIFAVIVAIIGFLFAVALYPKIAALMLAGTLIVAIYMLIGYNVG